MVPNSDVGIDDRFFEGEGPATAEFSAFCEDSVINDRYWEGCLVGFVGILSALDTLRSESCDEDLENLEFSDRRPLWTGERMCTHV